jgi:hypothetical protein
MARIHFREQPKPARALRPPLSTLTPQLKSRDAEVVLRVNRVTTKSFYATAKSERDFIP